MNDLIKTQNNRHFRHTYDQKMLLAINVLCWHRKCNIFMEEQFALEVQFCKKIGKCLIVYFVDKICLFVKLLTKWRSITFAKLHFEEDATPVFFSVQNLVV